LSSADTFVIVWHTFSQLIGIMPATWSQLPNH
jgi:hypothetical protein